MPPTLSSIEDEISLMLSIPDEELTEEQRKEMDAYLDDLGKAEADKVDRTAQWLRFETAQNDIIDAEIKMLQRKLKTRQNRINYMRHYLTETMRTNGLQKIQGSIYTFSLRKSTAVVVPQDLSALEGTVYVKEKREVTADKTVIKDALKRGVQIDGCSLVENLSLQIR